MVKFLGFNIGKSKPKTINVGGNWLTGSKRAKRKTSDVMQGEHGVEVDSVATTMRQYLSEDPDLAANVRRFVDNVLIEAPKLIAKHGEKVSPVTMKSYMSQLEDVRFYKLLRGAIYSLIFSGNSFIEVKFKGTKLKEAYNIDPDQMEVKVNQYGEVLGYEQTPLNGDGNTIKFKPEEIVHLTIDHFSTSVIGETLLKPLQAALLRKDIAESYLQWIIQNNKLAPIIDVKSDAMTDENWERVLSEIHYKKENADLLQVINTNLEDKIELVQLFTTNDFEVIMHYIEKQKEAIITLLQVPPIISGTVDNSNRSNSEIQARLVFYNTITAFQNLVAEELNYEMLKEKLKWTKVRFKFPSIDQRVDVETIKLAKSLRVDLNFTQDAIIAFLEENGFKIPNVDKLFEDPVDILAMQGKGPEQNSTEFESREPRDKSGLVKKEEDRQSDKEMKVSEVKN